MNINALQIARSKSLWKEQGMAMFASNPSRGETLQSRFRIKLVNIVLDIFDYVLMKRCC